MVSVNLIVIIDSKWEWPRHMKIRIDQVNDSRRLSAL